MTEIVILNSIDRFSGSIENGQIRLSNANKLDGTYKVVRFVMHNGLYNVNSFNNKIYFTETATPRIATLSLGSYSEETLRVEIETQMDFIGANTYTITYNSTTFKYTWSSTGDFAFTFLTNTANTSRFLLGINAIDDIQGTTATSDNAIDLSPLKIIFFNFPDASNIIKSSNGSVYSLYITNNSNGTDIIRTDLIDDNLFLTFTNKTNINYKMLDNNNNIIQTNGTEWELILRKD